MYRWESRKSKCHRMLCPATWKVGYVVFNKSRGSSRTVYTSLAEVLDAGTQTRRPQPKWSPLPPLLLSPSPTCWRHPYLCSWKVLQMASLGYPVNSKKLEIDHKGAITKEILKQAMQRPNTQFETITLRKDITGVLLILAHCEDWGPLRRLRMSLSTECKSLWTFLTREATSYQSPINTLVLEFKTGAFLPSNGKSKSSSWTNQ